MGIMKKHNDVTIFPNPTDLFAFAANDFSQRAIATVDQKGEFTVVLSGGNTPKSFFDALANNESYRKNIPWQHIRFFFGDERYVPSDNAASNYHMAYEHLFSKIPVDPKNIYRIPTNYDDPNIAASEYESTIRSALKLTDDIFPVFDLIYLGLGDDGHTASLMPLSDVVMRASDLSGTEPNQWVSSLFIPENNMYRITLTPSIINHAENIIFLVTHASKATVVWEVLKGKSNPQYYPAQLISSMMGKTCWYLDQAAARKL
jgi:6-phosphogluconolactonase